MNAEQLRRIMPTAPEPWLEAMVSETERLLTNLDTPREQASFIAQVAHESAELRHLEESLDYRAERLTVVWPRRFRTIDFAREYEHAPEKLANFVYATVNGNRGEASGDGWRYRGRGPFQLTGYRNYFSAGEWLDADLLVHPELVAIDPAIGVGTACWFWMVRGIDAYDDDEDVKAETKLINGGEIGLKQRQVYFDRALRILEEAA